MLSAAAGAVAPRPAAEPMVDRAPGSAANLAGGGERDGVAAQGDECLDEVVAEERSLAWQQPVATEVRGVSPSFLAGKATKTGQLLTSPDDVLSGQPREDAYSKLLRGDRSLAVAGVRAGAHARLESLRQRLRPEEVCRLGGEGGGVCGGDSPALLPISRFGSTAADMLSCREAGSHAKYLSKSADRTR